VSNYLLVDYQVYSKFLIVQDYLSTIFLILHKEEYLLLLYSHKLNIFLSCLLDFEVCNQLIDAYVQIKPLEYYL
jgi:hypothetical protein